MRDELVRTGPDGDVSIYSAPVVEELEHEPLLDLRTRLVLWLLCLLVVGLVFVGLSVSAA